MNRKIRVGIIFGGKSTEHEVSIQSARNIIDALDKRKYETVLIEIDKQGRWYPNKYFEASFNENNDRPIQVNSCDEQMAVIPGNMTNQLLGVSTLLSLGKIDVAFPVLHGLNGEDGSIQGLLKLANIPFVGASILGSAVGMDKDVMKRLLRDAGIPIANFMVFDGYSINETNFNTVQEYLGMPVFIKPANLGSSVGVSKVNTEKEFNQALQLAFKYDTKIIIEENINGREIECSVLGNEIATASLPGEILPHHDFYSYDAKYINENGATLKIPAELPMDVIAQIQDYAVKTFKVLCCEGMARVDFFLRDNKEILVNEINTIPGFTKISMYPKLWEISGISYSDLIDRLIQLALERFEKEQKLETSILP